MTKRTSDFTEMQFKKLKVDNVLNDLWGDDPSIDDCLIQATQVCEQNGLNGMPQNNVSILPNYSFFEQGHKGMITSTQTVLNGDMIKSTNLINTTNYNGNELNTINDNLFLKNKENALGAEIQKLKEKYECKEGEVTILRSQLKQLKTNTEIEHQKKEKEWTNKLNVFNKEINSVKSELEFKNLEIINLKNKALEMSKAYAMDNLFNCSQRTSCNKGDNNFYTFYTKNYRLEPILGIKYPLMNIIPLSMFNSQQSENFIINVKSSQACDFLNQDQGNEITSKYKNIVDSKHFKLDSILFDVSTLVKFNSLTIKTQLSYHHIDQILSLSKYAVQMLHNYLLISEGHTKKDFIKAGETSLEQVNEESDLKLCIFNSRQWCNGEVGIRARQTVAIMAEILPYSTYMQKSLLSSVTNKQNNFNDNIDSHLSLISVIIDLIHKTKRTQFCKGFLCAVAILLYKISQTQEFLESCLYVSNISKKIIFTKPPDIVLRNLILFFKQASVHPDFSRQLCEMPKLGIAQETSGSCQLPMFITLFKQNFIEKGNLDVTLGLNTLHFVKNLLNSNPSWLHYVENKNCECMCQIVILGIDVIHELVKNYKTKRRKILDKCQNSPQCSDVLKYCLKILHIMSFKYFDIINKYSVDSQYKFIVNYLHTLKDELSMADFENEALRELNVQEDIVVVDSTNFDKIPIWK